MKKLGFIMMLLAIASCLVTTGCRGTATPTASYELAEAINRGVIEVNIQGTGAASGDSITLSVQRIALENLLITIEPGTVLISGVEREQNMVIRRLKGLLTGFETYSLCEHIFLDSNEWKKYVLEAYCLDFHKDNPSKTTNFSIGGLPSEPAIKILRVLDEPQLETASIEVIQVAIWVAQEDITKEDVERWGYHLTPEDIELIRTILNLAKVEQRASWSLH